MPLQAADARSTRACARDLTAAADIAALLRVARADAADSHVHALLVPLHRDRRRLRRVGVAAEAAAGQQGGRRHQSVPHGGRLREGPVRGRRDDHGRRDEAVARRAARRLLVHLLMTDGRASAHELVHAVGTVLGAIAALGPGHLAPVEAHVLAVREAGARRVMACLGGEDDEGQDCEDLPHGGWLFVFLAKMNVK